MRRIPEGDPRLVAELRTLLREVGPERVWRTYLDCSEAAEVVCGKGHDIDGFPGDLSLVPELGFAGKSVADLGCNFGHFTLLAAMNGATDALGVDLDERMVRGAEIQRCLLGVENARFMAMDLLADPPAGRFDLAMLIDFLGKHFFATGMARGFLDAAEAHAGRELLLSVRSWYKIERHLGVPSERLAELYGPGFIRGDRFLAMKYVLLRLRPRWTCKRIWPRRGEPDKTVKQMLLFTRREP